MPEIPSSNSTTLLPNVNLSSTRLKILSESRNSNSTPLLPPILTKKKSNKDNWKNAEILLSSRESSRSVRLQANISVSSFGSSESPSATNFEPMNKRAKKSKFCVSKSKIMFKTRDQLSNKDDSYYNGIE
mmetsp:Transcript_26029/g.30037  ORF Transcript_26029/g.30037 Transcript_26029/m.30037 type:complete len:130 (-) Transcript_26029:29-418(-)